MFEFNEASDTWKMTSWQLMNAVSSELLKTKTIVSGAVSRQARWVIRRPLLTAGVSLWEQSNQEVRCCSMWVTRLQSLCSHLQIESDFWSCWSHQLKDQIYLKITWVYFFSAATSLQAPPSLQSKGGGEEEMGKETGHMQYIIYTVIICTA